MKKIYIFILCVAVLCTGWVYGTVFTATAEQEDSSPETQIEEPEEPEDLEELPEAESVPQPEDQSEPEAEEPEPEDSIVLPVDPEDSSEPESSSESEGDDSPQDQSLPKTTEPEEISQPETTQPGDEGGEEHQINPDIAAAMQAAYDSLDAYITRTADLLGMPGEYALDLGEDNFFDALTVYAIRHGQTENFPYAIELTEEDDRVELASIYWGLNPVNGANTEEGSVIHIRRLSGRNDCELTSEEKMEFSELCTDENRERMAELLKQ